MDKENYYEIKAVSQSQLTNLSYGPKYYKNNLDKVQEDTEAMTIGSLVDCLLTEQEAFDKKYYISKFSKPTAQMGLYVDLLFKSYVEDEGILHHENAYEQLKLDNGGKLRDSLEKFKERFEVEGKNYFDELVIGTNYKVITPEQYDTAKKVVESLLTNEFTSKEFLGEEVLYQLEITWDYISPVDNEVTKCKSKLDLVVINHSKHEICPKDIKVKMDSVGDFYSSYLKFRYDLQAAFYTEALEQFILDNDLFDKNGKCYTIKPFRFIVESAKYPGTPLIFEISLNDLNTGRYGGYYKGRYYKGYVELIEELKYYEKNNRFDYEKSVIENGGVVQLNVFDEEE
jgi:predicted RNA-binding protein associated with RNAse of E/G family